MTRLSSFLHTIGTNQCWYWCVIASSIIRPNPTLPVFSDQIRHRIIHRGTPHSLPFTLPFLPYVIYWCKVAGWPQEDRVSSPARGMHKYLSADDARWRITKSLESGLLHAEYQLKELSSHYFHWNLWGLTIFMLSELLWVCDLDSMLAWEEQLSLPPILHVCHVLFWRWKKEQLNSMPWLVFKGGILL